MGQKKEERTRQEEAMAHVFSGEAMDFEIDAPGSEAVMVEASVEVDRDGVVLVAEDEVEQAPKKVKVTWSNATVTLGMDSPERCCRPGWSAGNAPKRSPANDLRQEPQKGPQKGRHPRRFLA